MDETGFHRNIVYNNLDRLVKRGLATYVEKDGRRVYQAADPSALTEALEERKHEIEEDIATAERLADEIRQTKTREEQSTETQAYEGRLAIKSYLKTKVDDDVDVMGAPLRSVDVLGDTFWKNYNAKLKHRSTQVRLLLNPGLDGEAQRIENDHVTIRFLPERLQPNTEIRIYDEDIAQILWQPEPILIAVTSDTAVASHRDYFEYFWQRSGSPSS